MEMGPLFKVSSERTKKQGINLSILGLVVQHVIHYITVAPEGAGQYNLCNVTSHLFTVFSRRLHRLMHVFSLLNNTIRQGFATLIQLKTAKPFRLSLFRAHPEQI